GAYLGDASLSRCFADEYYSDKTQQNPDGVAVDLADTVLEEGLSALERREAVRALRGKALRVEVYALDGSEAEPHPYTVTEANFKVRRLQPRGAQRYAAFFAHDLETLTYAYERDPADPRVSQTAALAVDDYGVVTQSVAVSYPRVDTLAAITEQTKASIVLTERDVLHRTDDPDGYRLAIPLQARTYEVTGLTCDPTAPHDASALATHVAACTAIAYEDVPDASPEKRLLGHIRQLYYDDQAANPLTEGQAGLRALPYESRTLAFTAAQLSAVFDTKLTGLDLETEGGYLLESGRWWRPSGRVTFDKDHFFTVTEVRDVFGNTGAVARDDYDLLVTTLTGPLGGQQTAVHDYRVLQPTLTTDANDNQQAFAFDALGMLTKVA
ncbi:MAG: toxin, partial [Myxococcales bacterium]|nr:toxin [Myxococcales bacterium]